MNKAWITLIGIIAFFAMFLALYQYDEIRQLNQENNCELAMILSDKKQLEEINEKLLIWYGNKLSKRIKENGFWFFPDLTMGETGLSGIKDEKNLKIQDYFSSNNIFDWKSRRHYFWIEPLWLNKIPKSEIEVINNNCKESFEFVTPKSVPKSSTSRSLKSDWEKLRKFLHIESPAPTFTPKPSRGKGGPIPSQIPFPTVVPYKPPAN